MTELIYLLVVLALICVIVVTTYTGITEREKLLKMLMARDLKEVTDNEINSKRPPSTPQALPDAIEITPDDETLFDRAIKEQLRGPADETS